LTVTEGADADLTGASDAAACMSSNLASVANAGTSLGHRWLAGAEIDHVFPFSSTLVGADLFAEHLIGLSPLVDWTAELGVRRQWSPQIVLDAGIARHFAGSAPSTAVILGATYVLAIGHR
jgi:hypothetical protein